MQKKPTNHNELEGKPQLRRAYTPAEFAALFGRKPTWGYRKLYSGEVRRLQSSGRILIPVSEINRFAAKTVQHG